MNFIGDVAQFGVLLPHFGSHATRERLIDGAVQIERYGFDSVWVRDHVLYEPHSYEDPDLTHVDPIVTLSALASATKSLTLGTATLIPHRHPIHTALALGSLEFIAGANRIVLGVGIGTGNHEFDAIGMGDWNRIEVLEEQVEIIRRLWSGEAVSYQGKHYAFEDVEIRPIPYAGSLPIWYGGNSYAAARRAVEYCDGWLPGRMPRFAFKRRLQRLLDLADSHHLTSSPTVGMIPFVVPGKSVEEAAKLVDLGEYFAMTEKQFGLPPNRDRYENVRDLDGSVILGPTDEIVEGVLSYLDLGVDHFVFDCRLGFERWEEHLVLLGEEVLPQVRNQH